mmetsp:Transcript_6187/g.10997  ORF Transcript_6187/g.10997 Transcript_6187/m.10997 type:complete len:141 (+) Transcript_6187:94-516(+)
MTTKVTVASINGEILCEVGIDDNTRVCEVMKKTRAELRDQKICTILAGQRQLPPTSRLAKLDIEGRLTAVVVGKLFSLPPADLLARVQKAVELREIDYTVGELKDAGFDLEELKDAGFNAQELKDAGFNTRELKNAGFDA